jgi:ABC-type uncharacterized transport system substrate-binding protein
LRASLAWGETVTTRLTLRFAVLLPTLVGCASIPSESRGSRSPGWSEPLGAKRLEILEATLPKLHRVATFYDPGNPIAVAALKSARDAARQLQVEIVEARAATVRELRAYLASFKSQDSDAFFYVNDAMIRSQADLIIESMRAKKVPTMFSFPSIAEQAHWRDTA